MSSSIDLLDADPDTLALAAHALVPPCDDWQVRATVSRGERLSVRRDVVEPPQSWCDGGIMVGVRRGAGMAYAAVGAPDRAALAQAFERAAEAADAMASWSLIGPAAITAAPAAGSYRSPVGRPLLHSSRPGWIRFAPPVPRSPSMTGSSTVRPA
ncbi:MAG: hypothetical protein R3E83_04160 [Burkholderiaceae bacterium]